MDVTRRDMIKSASVVGIGAAALGVDPAEAVAAEAKAEASNAFAGICNLNPKNDVNGWHGVTDTDNDYNARVSRIVRVMKHSSPDLFRDLSPEQFKDWLANTSATPPRTRVARALYNGNDTADTRNIKLTYAYSYEDDGGDLGKFELYGIGGVWKNCNKQDFLDNALTSIHWDLFGDNGRFENEAAISFRNIQKSLIHRRSMIGRMLRRIKNSDPPNPYYSLTQPGNGIVTVKITKV
ncbi:hypothetical protein CA54_59330 [Symmachiella macrocystis]|uniref:Uncharacterized protein n=1 Tax=Symmachiella macrocystis TaxID=2527985 RepID=A0A5C6AYY0_9PLAN|nr:hypothetical protein [Symmachiella macrocystis]TWU05245.1 hypothetical protein CA54_59330 [Symmachiella macrocystis]